MKNLNIESQGYTAEKGNMYEGKEKRSEPRLRADQYCSVEFSISKDEPNYLFEIRDMSSSGLCIIVKEGSAVLNYLKVGDTIDMTYYNPEKANKTVLIKAEIKLELSRFAAAQIHLEKPVYLLSAFPH